MKSKIIITVLICMIYRINFAQSQNYYWSGGVKNYLYEDSKSMLIEVKKGRNIEALKGRLIKNELVEDVMEISSRNFLLIKTKEVIDIQRISSVYASINSASFGLKFNSNETFPMHLNGELLLQPKKDFSIQEVLNMLDSIYYTYPAALNLKSLK